MLGRFGRQFVTERFSLARAVRLQLDIYQQVLRSPLPRSMPDALRAAGQAFRLEVENHLPARKRDARVREQALLSAARQGAWPPADLS